MPCNINPTVIPLSYNNNSGESGDGRQNGTLTLSSRDGLTRVSIALPHAKFVRITFPLTLQKEVKEISANYSIVYEYTNVNITQLYPVAMCPSIWQHPLQLLVACATLIQSSPSSILLRECYDRKRPTEHSVTLQPSALGYRHENGGIDVAIELPLVSTPLQHVNNEYDKHCDDTITHKVNDDIHSPSLLAALVTPPLSSLTLPSKHTVASSSSTLSSLASPTMQSPHRSIPLVDDTSLSTCDIHMLHTLGDALPRNKVALTQYTLPLSLSLKLSGR
jgi:hypothetical protein